MGSLKVEKVQARDNNGQPVFLADGTPCYNYDVVGMLGNNLARAHMDVIEKAAEKGGSKGARGYAYSQLDLFFGAGENTTDVKLERVTNNFTNAQGEIVETVTYEVVIYDETGFDMRVPMRPRLTTDKVIIENLFRKQKWLEEHPQGADAQNKKNGTDSVS